MSHQLFKLPRQLNYNGNLQTVPGAKAYFYQTGTTTLQTVYQDADLTIPHANPVVADFLGFLPAIYMNPGVRHKLTLRTSADVDLYTVDPINDQIPATYTRTAAEIAAGVTPVDYAGSTRPWTDAVLRYGLNGDDSTDNTTAFTNLCAIAGQAIFIKRGTYRTGPFTLPANTLLYLEPGTVIKAVSTLGANDRLVNITNDNIHIVGWGAKVQMVRADYTSGEQRHGVRIYGAQNVTIEGLESSSTGGDGYYVGGDAGDPATRIKLIGVVADDNRRQGLSVVNARHFRAVDCLFQNTNGTAPCAGYDIEPNATTDVLEDIKMIRCRCVGNDGPGVEVFLAAWNATGNYADIEIIEQYTNDNGTVSQSGRLRPGIDINRLPSTTPCRGRIRVVDAVMVDEQQAGIHVYDWDVNGPLVELIRSTVINPNQAQGTTSTINGGIILHNSGSHTSTPGNIRVVDPMVRDDDGFLNAASLAPFRFSGAWAATEIHNPKYAYAGTNPWSADATAVPRIISVPEIFSHQTGNVTISDARYLGRTITNNGASGAITITLIQATSARVGWRLSFEVWAAQTMGIAPNGADKIVPLADGYAAGTSIKSSVRGSRLVLECRQAGYWHIVEKPGVWAIDPGSGTPPTYTASNVSTDRSYDANATTTDELADVLGTLINDLRERGYLR
jgi:hypothetical protein